MSFPMYNKFIIDTTGLSRKKIELINLDKQAGVGIRRLCDTLAAHAYLVHSRAYDSLLEKLGTESAAVDLLYTKYQRRNPCFGLVPGFAYQRPSLSDILGSEVPGREFPVFANYSQLKGNG